MSEHVQNENRLVELLTQKFGVAPNIHVEGNHADMFVPRTNITESGQALRWLADAITSMEAAEDSETKETLVKNLTGLYYVLRDCALIAQYELNFRESHISDPRLRGLDLMIRFRMNPDNDGIMMDIGAAVPREKMPDLEGGQSDDV